MSYKYICSKYWITKGMHNLPEEAPVAGRPVRTCDGEFQLSEPTASWIHGNVRIHMDSV